MLREPPRVLAIGVAVVVTLLADAYASSEQVPVAENPAAKKPVAGIPAGCPEAGSRQVLDLDMVLYAADANPEQGFTIEDLMDENFIGAMCDGGPLGVTP